jgi:hypothetical protein
MRANEFLSEATTLNLAAFKKETANKREYWLNLLDLIYNNTPLETTQGSIQLSNSKRIYNELRSIWDGQKPATDSQYQMLKDYKLKTNDRRFFNISQLIKTDDIKGKTTADASGKLPKFWNIGNVIEGILGGAVTARFKTPDKDITPNDIKKLMRSLKQNVNKEAKTLIPYAIKGRAGGNTFTFTLSLNTNDFRALELSYNDPATAAESYSGWDEIEKAYENASIYVNTANTILTALGKIESKKGNNNIIIESEGGSKEKQSSTKADLFITINGVKERLLSLKAGTVPQFGQVSGHAFANLSEFFRTTLKLSLPPEIEKLFPVGNFETVGKNIFQKGFMKAYQTIDKSLKDALKGNNDYAEYSLVQSVYEGIIHHATLGEEVIIVYLSPSARQAYQELKMGPELLEALKDFDLKPEFTHTDSAYRIKIVGIPKTPKGKEISGGKSEILIQLRSSIASNAIRNVIEVQKLLKILTDIEKVNERNRNPTTVAVDKRSVNKINPKQITKHPVTKKVEPKTTAPLKTITPVGSTTALDKAAKEKAIKDKMKSALAKGSKLEVEPEKKGR